MIPTAYLQAWSVKAPWPDLRQVEQSIHQPKCAIEAALRDLDIKHFLSRASYTRGVTPAIPLPQPCRGSSDERVRIDELGWHADCRLIPPGLQEGVLHPGTQRRLLHGKRYRAGWRSGTHGEREHGQLSRGRPALTFAQ